MARPPYSPEEAMEGETGPDTTDEEMLENVRQGMGEGEKMSKDEANYRQGTPDEHCEICSHYLGENQCEVVQGPIDPSAVSDEFVPQDETPEAPGDAGGGMY